MSWRDTFLVLIAFGAATGPLDSAAQAQPAGKVPRVGVLTENFSPPREDFYLDALRQGLRELGRIEGQNIVLEPRWGELGAKRMQDLALDLVRRKVDVIVVATNSAANAAKSAIGSRTHRDRGAHFTPGCTDRSYASRGECVDGRAAEARLFAARDGRAP